MTDYSPTYYRRSMSDEAYYLSMANRPLPENKFSKYRGVQKNSNPKKPYRASFRYKGRLHVLGAFASEIEAARAYNEAALAIVGDYAVLNVLPDDTNGDSVLHSTCSDL